MVKISKLPSTAQYLYSVDDIDGSVSKLYRAKSRRRLYLVTKDCIYSITPGYLSKLSDKILDEYGKIKDKNS